MFIVQYSLSHSSLLIAWITCLYLTLTSLWVTTLYNVCTHRIWVLLLQSWQWIGTRLPTDLSSTPSPASGMTFGRWEVKGLCCWITSMHSSKDATLHTRLSSVFFSQACSWNHPLPPLPTRSKLLWLPWVSWGRQSSPECQSQWQLTWRLQNATHKWTGGPSEWREKHCTWSLPSVAHVLLMWLHQQIVCTYTLGMCKLLDDTITILCWY